MRAAGLHDEGELGGPGRRPACEKKGVHAAVTRFPLHGKHDTSPPPIASCVTVASRALSIFSHDRHICDEFSQFSSWAMTNMYLTDSLTSKSLDSAHWVSRADSGTPCAQSGRVPCRLPCRVGRAVQLRRMPGSVHQNTETQGQGFGMEICQKKSKSCI